MAVPTTTELFDACTVLFGPDVEISLDFLSYLRPSGIKAAFRQKARETHPDRAKILGKNEDMMNELFKEVTLAYEKLSSAFGKDGKCTIIPEEKRTSGYRASRSDKKRSAHSHSTHTYSSGASRKNAKNTGYNAKTNGFRHQYTYRNKYKSNNQKNNGGSARSGFSDHFYRGAYLPKRELLLGQFLYYSGLVSWRNLIESVTWQRMNRPTIGQLAADWNLLNPDEIRRILMLRNFGEKFGECAIRMKYVNSHTIQALLWKQRRVQQPIGEFFVINHILKPEQIDEMVKKLKLHNYNAVLYKRKTGWTI